MTTFAFVVFCCLVGVYANSQGRDWGWWVLWSVLFSPVVTAVILFILGKKNV